MRNRTKSREYALQMLYQADIRRTGQAQILEEFWQEQETPEEVKAFANQLVMGNAPSGIPGSEVLIVHGATLNEDNTHGWLPGFVPSKALVRVDINPNNVLGKEYQQSFITGDVRAFMEWLQANRALYHDGLKSTAAARQAWLDSIRKTPYYVTDADRASDSVPMNPARVIA